MALIKCPECGHDVSTFANMCPNCGYPIKDNQLKTISVESDDSKENPSIGDIIEFGSWVQTDSGEAKKIKWVVLGKDGDGYKLLSLYGLETLQYHNSHEYRKWNDCTLRQWLNNTFYNKAFTSDEKKSILSTVRMTNNSLVPTMDMVSLPTIDEVQKQVPKQYILCEQTPWCKKNGGWQSDNNSSIWWLMQPGQKEVNDSFSYTGYGPFFTACVAHTGEILARGDSVDETGNVIRPLITIVIENIKSYANVETHKVGDTIEFGSYPQESNGNIKAIKWRILEKIGKQALLLSEYALDCQSYNSSCTFVTWETCSVRKWLNDTFFNNAFNVNEKERIQSTTILAEETHGNATTDKIFLLSKAEAKKYFSSDEDRKCVPTAYAITKSPYISVIYTKGGMATSSWWLRSLGKIPFQVVSVKESGSIDYVGNSIYHLTMCIRPALWINLGS